MFKDTKRADKKSRFKFYFLIILFLLLVISSFYFSSMGINIRNILDYLIKSPYAGALFILLYIATSFIPLPFAPTSFVGALLFPLGRAFIYTMIGSLLFSIIMFFIARLLGRDFVRQWLERHVKFKYAAQQMNKGRLRDLILIRFFFILPTEFVNVIYGLSEIRFDKYFLGTLIGNLPVIFFSIMLVRSRLANNEINVMIALVALGLLLLIPLLSLANIRRCFRKKGKAGC